MAEVKYISGGYLSEWERQAAVYSISPLTYKEAKRAVAQRVVLTKGDFKSVMRWIDQNIEDGNQRAALRVRIRRLMAKGQR